MIQILTKELFYELDAENRKLIVFSDSREETAQTSNGIERNHYQDLIREILYNELKLTVNGLPVLLSDVEEKYESPQSDLAKKYESKHPGSFKKLLDKIKYIRNCEQLKDPSEEIKNTTDRYVKEIEDIRKISTTNVVPLNILFKKYSDQTLLLRLKNMGINPSGNKYDTIWDSENKKHLWYDLFSLSDNELWNNSVLGGR